MNFLSTWATSRIQAGTILKSFCQPIRGRCQSGSERDQKLRNPVCETNCLDPFPSGCTPAIVLVGLIKSVATGTSSICYCPHCVVFLLTAWLPFLCLLFCFCFCLLLFHLSFLSFLCFDYSTLCPFGCCCCCCFISSSFCLLPPRAFLWLFFVEVAFTFVFGDC